MKVRSFTRTAALLAGVAGAMLLPVIAAAAAPGIPAVVVQGTPGGQSYSLTLQLLILMTAVTLLPSIFLMMTAFTRIVIVLSILRQAIGAGQAPPNQVLIGLSLFLTFFVMAPVVDQINVDAVQPYMAGTIENHRSDHARHGAPEEIHAGPDTRERHRHLRADHRRHRLRQARRRAAVHTGAGLRHQRAEKRPSRSAFSSSFHS